MRFLKAAACLLLAAIGVTAWIYMRWPEQEVYGGVAAPDQSRPGWELGYGMTMTILGVVLGSAYRRLTEMKQKGRVSVGSPGTFFKKVFTSIDLWLGLCGAPILFALILRSADGMDLPGYTAVALENGFCCLVVIASISPQASGSTAAAPKA